MKRLAFLILALSWADAALGHGESGRGPQGCVAGPPEPRDPLLSMLPPQGTAICHYPPAEFHARVDRLLAVPAGRLGSAQVERIFSLPPLTITREDPRSTTLGIILRSAPAKAWWSALIYVQEGFFGPRFEGPPIPLRGLRRPVPVDPRRPGDISVRIVQLSLLDPLVPRPPGCLTVSALLDSARRQGWTAAPRTTPVPHSAPPGWRHVDMVRGGLTFSTGFSDEQDCVLDFTLGRLSRASPSAP